MVRLLENERGRRPGGLLCGPPAADHDRFGSDSDVSGRNREVRFTSVNRHHQLARSLPKSAVTRSAQRPSVHLSSFKPRQLRRPKEKPPEGCEGWNSQSTPADCRARKVSSIKKSGLSRSCLVLQARTPLTIVAHILPGRRLVVRPTLGAMQSSSAARHHGADCLSTAQPAAADAHRTAAATEPRGEGRGCNC